MEITKLPVAIIGGGPVGLAAAAQLVKRNEQFILLESGSTVANNMLQWGHVRIFSPWRYTVDKAAEELLLASGWQWPDKEQLPTGREIYEHYLLPLSQLPPIQPQVVTSARVTAITRKGYDKMKSTGRERQPFVLQVEQGGQIQLVEARAVIDASGTWQQPNPLGAGGLYALGEQTFQNRITYGIPDVTGVWKDRYKNKRVLVVGSGHSAINSILELYQLRLQYPATEIHWVLRKKNLAEVFGGGENDQLPARGALGTRIENLVKDNQLSVYTPFDIEELREEKGGLTVIGTQQGFKKMLGAIDEIIANTGARPDLSFLRELRVETDSTVESVPALADLIDPNIHSCGTVRPHGEAELRQREKDFYVVGIKSYGRAPTFLMATGYEQVRSVVAALVGDWEAASRVELDLPETGVCKSDGGGEVCCGVSPTKKASCC